MRVTHTRLVQAPIERVFAAVCDLRPTSRTSPTLSAFEVLTPGPVGVGTRYRETHRLKGTDVALDFEVVAFEPGRRFATTLVTSGVRYGNDVVCSAEGDATRVVAVDETTPVTLGGRVVFVLAWWFNRKGARGRANALDALAERCASERAADS